MQLTVNFVNMKRQFNCCVIDSTDTYAYVGTQTGDVLEVLYIYIITYYKYVRSTSKEPFIKDWDPYLNFSPKE